MSDAKLAAVPAVDIEEGVFKYILIKVYGQVKDDGSEPHKLVVRGYKDCEWHCKSALPAQRLLLFSAYIISWIFDGC